MKLAEDATALRTLITHRADQFGKDSQNDNHHLDARQLASDRLAKIKNAKVRKSLAKETRRVENAEGSSSVNCKTRRLN